MVQWFLVILLTQFLYIIAPLDIVDKYPTLKILLVSHFQFQHQAYNTTQSRMA